MSFSLTLGPPHVETTLNLQYCSADTAPISRRWCVQCVCTEEQDAVAHLLLKKTQQTPLFHWAETTNDFRCRLLGEMGSHVPCMIPVDFLVKIESPFHCFFFFDGRSALEQVMDWEALDQLDDPQNPIYSPQSCNLSSPSVPYTTTLILSIVYFGADSHSCYI